MPTKSCGSSTLHAPTCSSSKPSSSVASQASDSVTSATSDGVISKRWVTTTGSLSSCRKRKTPSPTSSTTMPYAGSLLGKDAQTNPSSTYLSPPPSRRRLHNGYTTLTSRNTSPSTRHVTAMRQWRSWQEQTSTPSPSCSVIATSKLPPSTLPSLTPNVTRPPTTYPVSTRNGAKHANAHEHMFIAT